MEDSYIKDMVRMIHCLFDAKVVRDAARHWAEDNKEMTQSGGKQGGELRCCTLVLKSISLSAHLNI